ncbi:hypothetical protein [Pseudomonas fluorescens]
MTLLEVSLTLGAPLDEVALELSYCLDTIKVDSLTLIISSSENVGKELSLELIALGIAPTSTYISECALSNLDLACIAILFDIDKPLTKTYRFQFGNPNLTQIKPWSLTNIVSQLSAPETQLRKINFDWFSQSTKHLKVSIDDYTSSNISEIIREGMIALGAIFRFEELRTAIGSCSLPFVVQSSSHIISSTIRDAIKYARDLHSSKSIAFNELRHSLDHLADGSLAADVFNSSASDLILYRKVLVWQSSLHLALATSLSKREGSSNLSLHHCIRSIECYLIGVLSASNKLYLNHKGVVLYTHDSKAVQGISGLLALSPETVPSVIKDIVTWRNKSELAHGMQRWDSATALLALSEVKNFIHSMDSKYSQGEFFIHLRKGTSLNFSEAVESIITVTKQRINDYLIKII